MHDLLTAIMAQFSGSALETFVGGRIYLDEAPDGTAYPNVVFMVVASTPEDTFTEQVESTLIQVSLFSTSQSASEVTTMHADLTALFDNTVLTLASGTNLSVTRETLSTSLEEITTSEGTQTCKHWSVDYSIMVHK